MYTIVSIYSEIKLRTKKYLHLQFQCGHFHIDSPLLLTPPVHQKTRKTKYYQAPCPLTKFILLFFSVSHFFFFFLNIHGFDNLQSIFIRVATISEKNISVKGNCFDIAIDKDSIKYSHKQRDR